MGRIMLVSAITLMLLTCITSTIQYQSTCSDIHTEPLERLSGCVTQGNSLQGQINVVCNGNVNVTLFLSVLQEIRPVSNQKSTAHCAGLHRLEGRNGIKSWFLTFDSSQAIGIIRADKNCRNSESNSPCILEVQLLATVWDLPAFHYDPETDEFWNFSSPYSSAVVQGLHGVGVNECEVRYRWLEGLQNTSVSTLSINRGDPSPYELLLPSLPAVKRLVITRCGLIYFNRSNFAALPNVEELTLSSNPFQGIPEGISQLKNLKFLDISRNLGNNFSIPTEEIQELKQLQYLNLAHNFAIKNFKMLEQLPYLPNLKVLNLSSCRLPNPEEGEADPFKKFPALQVLDLSRNYLNSWNTNFLSNRTLKLLDFTRNKFTESPILKCCEISILCLSFNKLLRLANMCNYGTHVTYLDVSLNNISEWKNQELFSCLRVPKFSNGYEVDSLLPNEENVSINTFHDSSYSCENRKPSRESWVHHIDLSGNNIHAVTQEMIDSLSDVVTVDLEGNPFDCVNCSTPYFVEWMRASKKVNSSEKLICKFPVTNQEDKVMYSKSYEEICFPEDFSAAVLAMGHVLAICLLIILVILATGYWYRTEISYTLHLFKIRNTKHCNHYDSYTYDAFICYSGRDRAWVMRTLVPTLENSSEKYRLCLHDRDFALGSMIVDNIVHCIDKSRRVIIVLSQHFVTSKWCQWELDMANHKSFEDSSCFLILIRLEILERQALPRHLKLLMDTRTYLEWPTKQEAQPSSDIVFKRLKDAMGPSIHQVVQKREAISIEASA